MSKTGAQTILRTREIAQDLDDASLNYGLTDAEWLNIINEAQLDLFNLRKTSRYDAQLVDLSAAAAGDYHFATLGGYAQVDYVEAVGTAAFSKINSPVPILPFSRVRHLHANAGAANSTPPQAIAIVPREGNDPVLGGAIVTGVFDVYVWPAQPAATILATLTCSQSISTTAMTTTGDFVASGVVAGSVIHNAAFPNGRTTVASVTNSTNLVTTDAALSAISSASIVFDQQRWLAGWVRKFPTAITTGTTVVDLPDDAAEWLCRLAALRGASQLGQDPDFIDQIAQPLPDDIKALVKQQDVTTVRRPRADVQALP